AIVVLAGTLGGFMRLMAEPPMGGILFLALLSPIIVLAAAILVWLQRAGPSLSFRALRGIELVLFGSLCLSMMAITLAYAPGALDWCSQLGGAGMSLGARFPASPWFSVVIVYGVFIPNTWRRCAGVVGTMALTPLVIHAAVGLADQTLDKGLLFVFLLEMG